MDPATIVVAVIGCITGVAALLKYVFKFGDIVSKVNRHESHFEKIIVIENEIKELRNLVQPIYSNIIDAGLNRIKGHQSESYLISSRGEAVIPDENKKQIQTFIKQRKDLLDKSLHEITFAATSAVDLPGTLNGIINKLPKEIDLPTEFAFGIFTAYVGNVAAETLIEEADELFAKGDKEKAKSKIAKAANLYEEIGEIKKAADTHINFAKKLFDWGKYASSKDRYYYGALILIKNNMLKEAAEIMEEASNKFNEKPSEKQRQRAKKFFECASSFREAADDIAKGNVRAAVKIIKKLCEEFKESYWDWGESCSELLSKLKLQYGIY